MELEPGHPNIISHPQKTGKKKKLLVLISQKPDRNVIFFKAPPLSGRKSCHIPANFHTEYLLESEVHTAVINQ